MYKFIKKYYLMELYSDTDLDVFVTSKDISEAQKAEIIASKVSAS